MIPVKLSIEGLYSYQDKQHIDFTELTKAGLFGIFGEVGSGKSSILEAISFSLYGETERMNSREKRAYNMMNLKSNRMSLEFDFYNYQNKLFRTKRDFKRNSKRFEDVKPDQAVFYEFINDVWIPLDHTNAELILGLSYENFKRTIIIPQGQFKEFIELGAMDRTKMMKEIFGLHRFDLQDKTARLKSENKSELDQLNGKLEGIEEVNDEIIQQKESDLVKIKSQFESIQKENDELSLVYLNLQMLKTDFENLDLKKKEFEKLEVEQSKFEQKQKEIDEFELVSNTFMSDLKDQNSYENEKIELTDLLNLSAESLKDLSGQKVKIENELLKIQEEYSCLRQKRIQENDLELICQILQEKSNIQSLKERSKNGFTAVESKKNEEIEVKDLIGKIDLERKEKEKTLIPSQLLMEVGNWFVELKSIGLSVENQKNSVLSWQDKLIENSKSLPSDFVDFETFEKEIVAKNKDLKTRKSDLESQKSHLEVHQKLAEYAHELHDGKACPLCGSLEHPNIAGHVDESEKLNYIKEEILKINQEIELNQNEFSNVQIKINERKSIQEQLEKENKILEDLIQNEKNHQKKFSWNDFKSDDFQDFESKKHKNSELENELKSLNKNLEQTRIKLETIQNELKKYEEGLDNFKIKESESQGKIDQNLANLKVLNFNDYEEKPIEIVQFLLNNLVKNNNELELKYNDLQNQLNEILPKRAEQNSKLEVYSSKLKELQESLDKLENQLNFNLKKFNFESVDKVRLVLSKDLNVSVVRKDIEAFKIRFETLKNSIEELNLKLKDESFDAQKWEETERNLAVSKDKFTEVTGILAKVVADFERLSKLFDAKKTLLLDKEKLELRASNLDILFNLFKAQGFVNYISSIYLNQLCDHANQRFHRMTRNQLSLKLNENNDFEIIDYLNEGKSRSVKTLSGGQTFQVSLSLALALAESVQTSAQADKNFFFIDEGFGTQDPESVNIVFETLKNLQKENRIVGIISHVEELKEKIPMSLNVVKSAEFGSRIEIS